MKINSQKCLRTQIHFSLSFIEDNIIMDLLKTPSVQSLLDSDLESVESLQYLDIEEVS